MVTYPTSGPDGPSVAADVELVKAAVLYADHVELVSLGAAMLGGTAAVAGSQDALLELVSDPDLLRSLSGRDVDPEILQNLPALLKLARTPLGAELGIASIAEDFDAQMRSSMAEMTDVVEGLIRSSGAEELIPCIDRGVLALSDAGLSAGGDSDRIIEAWIDQLRARLNDGTSRLLFDNGTGDLVAAMLREGMIEASDVGLRRAGQAATGSGLVAHLPAFPQAPMDELLDLREDLSPLLQGYRSAVVKLAKTIPLVVGREQEAYVDDLWQGEVAPALADIHDGLADHGLVKEIYSGARRDIRTLLFEGATLYIGMNTLHGLSNWISATASVAGLAVQASVIGVTESRHERRQIGRHELFFLYEAGRRLQAN